MRRVLFFRKEPFRLSGTIQGPAPSVLPRARPSSGQRANSVSLPFPRNMTCRSSPAACAPSSPCWRTSTNAGYISARSPKKSTRRTPGGKLIFHIFGALAEFERGLIIERTREGMKAARARGIKSGPPPKLTRQQTDHARQLIEDGQGREQVADLFKVSRSTLYRAPS